MAVHGTRQRDAVSWDYPGLLDLLGRLAKERTGLSLLRCYWYEATVEGRRTPEHDALADLPNVKLRLGRIRPGRREGVDALIYRDLTTLAQRNAACDAIVVSGDEDMVQAVIDAQDHGIRVSVVHVTVDGNWTVARTLRQECDGLIEMSASHLRPYVNLLSGMDTSAPPLSNGQATGSGAFPAPAAPHPSPHSGPQFASEHPSGPHQLPGPAAYPGSHAGSGPIPAGSGPLITGPSSGPTYVPPQRDAYGPSHASSNPPPAPSLNDAVKAAHQEGHDFGETVARDAPALWLEAVLARKPRMPSDLEARLLQGSSLPIDFLLQDEVRHALRRGFWDALEGSRR